MNTKNLALTGTGFIVAAVGLGAIGAALILPGVIALTASAVGKVSGRLINEMERASKTAGSVAGTLHRSFNEAAKAGITEIRKSA